MLMVLCQNDVYFETREHVTKHKAQKLCPSCPLDVSIDRIWIREVISTNRSCSAKNVGLQPVRLLIKWTILFILKGFGKTKLMEPQSPIKLEAEGNPATYPWRCRVVEETSMALVFGMAFPAPIYSSFFVLHARYGWMFL